MTGAAFGQDRRFHMPGRIAQFVFGFAVIAALFYSWIWTLTFINRVNIYRNRDNYRPANFVVTGAEYHRDDEGGDSWWLKGTVSGREERYVPRLRGAATPRGAEDLLASYPVGSSIEVFYNPEMTEMLVQGESLRVLGATPDLWQEEERARKKLAVRVLIPFPTALALYLIVRYVNRQQRRPEPQSHATVS